VFRLGRFWFAIFGRRRRFYSRFVLSVLLHIVLLAHGVLDGFQVLVFFGGPGGDGLRNRMLNSCKANWSFWLISAIHQEMRDLASSKQRPTFIRTAS
jgi:hypothetical protein